MGEDGFRGWGGVEGGSSVIFNRCGATAKKTDRDKQKDRKGMDKQKQGDGVLRNAGREGWRVEGRADQARLFGEAGERQRQYMKSCFYLARSAPLVIKVTGFIHGDILPS